jgi:hypothetical protein
VSSADNEFEILVGRIGNRGRRESFINEVLRAQRQAGVEPGSTTGRRGGPGGGRSAFFGPHSAAAVCSPPIVASSSRPGWSAIGGAPSRSAPLSAHVAHLERDGVTRDGKKGRTFAAAEDRAEPWPSRDAAGATGIISVSSSRRRMPLG